MVKVIKTRQEYEAAIREAETLLVQHPAPGSEEGDRLELLAFLISAHEEEQFPLGMPTPIEAIRFRMEQKGLSQRDLIPYIGSRSRVSEVLNGKRRLTLRMIRAVHKGLDIPADVLLQAPESRTIAIEDTVEWGKFPIREMARRHWFSGFSGRPSDAPKKVKRLLTDLFQRAGLSQIELGFLRQHVRSGSQMDDYALAAWSARVVEFVRTQSLATDYKPGSIDSGFMSELVKLSSFETGPLLAKEFLSRSGIHFVVLSHLPRTHLDGAAMLLDDGAPIVAVTLRHDRLDNFWFCLCHELAHLALHLDHSYEKRYFDDLDAQGDSKECEADRFAERALIPPRRWGNASVRARHSPDAVKQYAQKLRIHPAIVAGRIRREQNNYRLLWTLVGNKQVRRHFPGYLLGIT